MSKGQTLRALVNARLAAAADEIFALFERTIAEYEAETCFYKEQNQRKQQLVESVLSPKVVLFRVDDVQRLSLEPNNGMNQENNPAIKEEPVELSIKQEENCQQELANVCVKTEETPQIQQWEDTQAEDILETHLHPEENREHTTDHDEDWEAPFSWSDVETEAEEEEMEEGENKKTDFVHNDHCYHLKIRDTSPAEPNSLYPEINVIVKDEDEEDLPVLAAVSRHKSCSFCGKRFKTAQLKQMHETIHTGEKLFSCPFCKKRFRLKQFLLSHMRVHTGEKPFRCPICNKAFAHIGNLCIHKKLHTGDRPFACSFCEKTFTTGSGLNKHLKGTFGRCTF